MSAGFAHTGRRALFQEGVLSPLGVFTTIASVAFVTAGVVWPQAAAALLRLLLATLAFGFIVARAHDAIQSLREEQKTYSPFHGGAADSKPPSAPRVVQELTYELVAADDSRLASRTPIPWSIRRAIAREAERRLVERHALTLADPHDHAAIRTLVADPTWSMLRTYSETADPSARPRSEAGHDRPATHARSQAVAAPLLSSMSEILDDLERL